MSIFEKSGNVIQKLDEKTGGTIKGLIMGDPGIVDKKRTMALVCETLKFRTSIEVILAKAQFLKHVPKKPKISQHVALVLVYDFLFGQGGKAAGRYRPSLLAQKSRLHSELVRYKLKLGIKHDQDLIPESIRNAVILPRFVRVNTLKNSTKAAIKTFTALGFTLQPTPTSSLNTLPAPKSFYIDSHVSDLLVFPPSTDFHAMSIYLEGGIVLQDKASCFPAFCLSPPKNSTVIDACAAPGNKTSHLSMLMANSGHIVAFDKDSRRLGTLKKLTSKAGCTNIHAVLGDFLQTDPKDSQYAHVEYILLDPSCSGSGIVSRMDHLTAVAGGTEDEQDPVFETERIGALADFQLKTLLHAFKFPRVKKIVYSTCSVHQAENEDVVKQALESASGRRFALIPALSVWPRRGWSEQSSEAGQVPSNDTSSLSPDQAKCLVRTLPEEDGVIGFFVALFERKH